MNSNCPDCGNNLYKSLDLSQWWIELLHCDNGCGYFLSVLDMRNIYPLQRLDRGVGQILLKAEDSTIELAVKRIKRIDHKTISVVFFEHTLLGCYDVQREYEVNHK